MWIKLSTSATFKVNDMQFLLNYYYLSAGNKRVLSNSLYSNFKKNAPRDVYFLWYYTDSNHNLGVIEVKLVLATCLCKVLGVVLLKKLTVKYNIIIIVCTEIINENNIHFLKVELTLMAFSDYCVHAYLFTL